MIPLTNATMEQQFKLLTAKYIQYEHYKIPLEWDVKDINIKWGTLYYKGEEVKVPYLEGELDMKRPSEIEDDEVADLELYFDCEDDDE